jgi:hypothetical protein
MAVIKFFLLFFKNNILYILISSPPPVIIVHSRVYIVAFQMGSDEGAKYTLARLTFFELFAKFLTAIVVVGSAYALSHYRWWELHAVRRYNTSIKTPQASLLPPAAASFIPARPPPSVVPLARRRPVYNDTLAEILSEAAGLYEGQYSKDLQIAISNNGFLDFLSNFVCCANRINPPLKYIMLPMDKVRINDLPFSLCLQLCLSF